MNILKKSCLMLCLNCLALVSFGQITLEHTFPTSIRVDFEYISEPTELFYVTTDDQVKLYNSNYSLYKTINLNLPSGYSILSVILMGRHIINTDDKVEFFVTAFNINALNNNYNNYQTLLLINEDGQVISNFGYSYSCVAMGTYKIGNQIKVILSKSLHENNTTTDQSLIYSCSGNYSPNYSISSSQNNSKLNPFPNPTMSRINLPYKLEEGKTSSIRVYNLNGQLMDTFNIGSDFEFISIDVSNYAKGVYVYEYNGISNKFVVQ